MFKRTLLFISWLLISKTIPAQDNNIPQDWYLLDKNTNGYYGISSDKAYDYIKAKKLKSNTVLVAVIDSGIDTTHEDLKQLLWRNPNEIPGNGIDDDKNGYTDDYYGWNFLGNKNGENLLRETDEATRTYHHQKNRWEQQEQHPAPLNLADSLEFAAWKAARKQVLKAYNESSEELNFIKKAWQSGLQNDSLLRIAMDKEVYTGRELQSFNPYSYTELIKARKMLYGLMLQNDALESTNQEFLEEFGRYYLNEEKKLESLLEPPASSRFTTLKDDPYDFSSRNYGNNNVMVSNTACMHGTFVSGIIAADRNNSAGIRGIADNVQIMSLRILTDGDAYDKDLANAIYYAVDNGALIINLSLGKNISPQKNRVDEAVRYAAQHDVLIVHAVGNASKNLDSIPNYPSPVYLDGSLAANWIGVASSGDTALGELVPSFTNYGYNMVDVFAPGMKIYTCVPGNNYKNLQGTGTSCPIVTGVAAFLLEYYPKLSAAQLKMIIEQSVLRPDAMVSLPGEDKKVAFASLSHAGGIVNQFNAIKLAGTIKGERNLTKSRGRPGQ